LVADDQRGEEDGEHGGAEPEFGAQGLKGTLAGDRIGNGSVDALLSVSRQTLFSAVPEGWEFTSPVKRFELFQRIEFRPDDAAFLHLDDLIIGAIKLLKQAAHVGETRLSIRCAGRGIGT
jgi:hypothetical protein